MTIAKNFNRFLASTAIAATAFSFVGSATTKAQAAPLPGLPTLPGLPVLPGFGTPIPALPIATIPLTPILPIDVIIPPLWLLPTKDVAVGITDDRTTAAPGDNLVYTITVTNKWSAPATGIAVLNSTPAGLGETLWSCTVPSGGSCGGPVTGTGSINRNISLAAQTTAVFTVSAIVAGTTSNISSLVTIVPPVGFGDNNAADNTASDVDTVQYPAASTTTAAPTPTLVPVPSTTTAPATTTPPPVIVSTPATTLPTSTIPPAAPTTAAPIVIVIQTQASPVAVPANATPVKAASTKAKAKGSKAKRIVARKAGAKSTTAKATLKKK
jgi:uncharacterized repeat protein (TIGR01451 family)